MKISAQRIHGQETMDSYASFANKAVDFLLQQNIGLQPHQDHTTKLLAPKADGAWASVDLTPFACKPMPCTAYPLFSEIASVEELIDSYSLAYHGISFEPKWPGTMEHVDAYAQQFLDQIFDHARQHISNQQAKLIGNLVKDLDLYCAIKSIESLFYSRADLALLQLAEELQWNIHFDHLAIRCGTAKNHDAERIVELLSKYHGYTHSQVVGEEFYQFEDGWNAYPLYKMLSNGQCLRVFVDQSDGSQEQQIIQHWNRVYGYTAHHLALRATKQIRGERVAVNLHEIIERISQAGLEVMEPTGDYTKGLLLQVFTKPEINQSVPASLLDELQAIDPELPIKIKNAKLLEIVSRDEMPEALAQEYFQLYGLSYDGRDPLHSVPYYQYFLPAQAAHVIRTSVL